ncbi:hypothetical protein RJT34_30564 [Clitoria ternatea]|uniref:Uncharacterized protein n=1 Tax=Clitoria ternatea TaxID=43366 RepID=A0AAN9EUU0_CLITE
MSGVCVASAIEKCGSRASLARCPQGVFDFSHSFTFYVFTFSPISKHVMVMTIAAVMMLTKVRRVVDGDDACDEEKSRRRSRRRRAPWRDFESEGLPQMCAV